MPLLFLRPKSINFPPPLTSKQPQTLEVHNVTSDYVAYKIRTTAPARYAVSPNLGIIKPRETAQVSILFNALKSQEIPTKPDSFQVIGTVVEVSTTLQELRKNWSSIPSSELSLHKIKSTFNSISEKEKEQPDFVETTRRQNDQLSRQEAELKNEKESLQQSMSNLEEKTNALNKEKQQIEENIKISKNTVTKPTSSSPSTVEIGIVLFCCLISFYFGYALLQEIFYLLNL